MAGLSSHASTPEAVTAMPAAAAAAAAAAPKAAYALESCAKPAYPAQAAREGQEGAVTLSFLIGADGSVIDSKVVKSSGFPLLDIASQQGLENCKFKPPVSDGKPRPTWMPMQYVWALEGADKAKAGMADATPAPAAPAPAATVDLSNCARPVYPKEAARDGHQGKVILAYLISADGAVLESKVLSSSGFPALDMAAQESIGRCKFKPAMVDGKPGQAWAKLRYVWALSDPGGAALAGAVSRAWLGAERGEALSQYRLGLIYSNGKGVEKNPGEGMKWLRKAAVQGHPMAQGVLGQMLAAGFGDTRNQAEAVDWYRKAAQQGLPSAQYDLGRSLLRGEGVPMDAAEAQRWLREAAEQGLARAQVSLATQLLQDGDAGAAEVGEAIGWLRKAAGQNDPVAQSKLALCYETGRGVPRDDAQAAAWYQKAAAAGNSQAQLALAGLYERGQGVPADAAKAADLQRAALQSRKPAK